MANCENCKHEYQPRCIGYTWCQSCLDAITDFVRSLNLGGIDYQQYIQSPAWKRKAARAKARSGHRCQVCNSPDNLEAHHRTYERLGHERPGDITVLCAECHSRFHNKRR